MDDIVLYGGMFDPVHLDHVRIVKKILDETPEAYVFIIPNGKSPNGKEPMFADVDRVEMLRLAFKGDPRLTVSDVELKRPGVSYTVDTVGLFKVQHPDARIRLVMGMDEFVTLHTWHKAEELVDMVHIIEVFPRPGCEERAPEMKLGAYRCRQSKEIPLLCGLTSTKIREWIKQGRNVEPFVPSGALPIIRQYGENYDTEDI